ncbi:MAG: hypothetical protein R3D85_12810 [Paracoccaceae bacterium]
MDIRENSDAGTPVVVSQPDSTHSAIYKKIAIKVAARLFPRPTANRPPAERTVEGPLGGRGGQVGAPPRGPEHSHRAPR